MSATTVTETEAEMHQTRPVSESESEPEVESDDASATDDDEPVTPVPARKSPKSQAAPTGSRTKLIKKKAPKQVKTEDAPRSKKSSRPANIVATIPKKRRYRPGTVALREIRKYQKTTELLIPKASMYRLIREIAMDESRSGDIRWQKGAFMALHESAEEFLTEFITDSYNVSLVRGKVTLSKPDFDLAKRMRRLI